jgi:hypothetical protein
MTSCYTAKQMNKTITLSVTEDVIKNCQVKDSNTVLNTEKLELFTPSAKVNKIHYYFIPAFLYWETRDLLLAEINNRAYINNFTEALNRKAIENNFAQKLQGRKLEISLESTPNQFYYDYQHIMICFIVGYYQTFHANIHGKDQELKISYRITKDNLEIKNGSFATPFTDKELKENTWTTAEAIKKYVELNRLQFITNSEKLIQLVANEL